MNETNPYFAEDPLESSEGPLVVITPHVGQTLQAVKERCLRAADRYVI